MDEDQIRRRCPNQGVGPERSRLTGRSGVISALGAMDAQSAIRIVHGSRYLDQLPRQRDALIRHLGGENLREVGEAHGVSKGQAWVMVQQAMMRVITEIRAPEKGDQILRSLSARARNCLLNEALPTDEAVRDWVQENGTRALLRAPNMGRKTYLEICDAFGFDSKELDRPPTKKGCSDPEPSRSPPTGLQALALRIPEANDGPEPF